MHDERGMARNEWKRITEKACKYGRFERGDFTGWAGVIDIRAVTAPLVKLSVGSVKCLADAGYSWVQISPDCGGWWLTAMLDENHKLVQYYFDITLKNFVAPDGEPRFVDLYLDIVLDPEGNWEILDRDELDEALRAGDITKPEHALAISRCEALSREIDGGESRWRALVMEAYLKMRP